MTADEAAALCLDNHARAGFVGDTRVTGEPRVVERFVDPKWLVLIPAENEYGPLYIDCRLGGPADNPSNRGVGEASVSVYTEEYIEWLRYNNEGL